MTRALEGLPTRDFEKPDSVAVVQVDTATGMRAVPGRPSRMEVFAAGTEPRRFAPSVTDTPTPGAAWSESPAADATP